MIQGLPLLPAEWVGWDWAISNGNATAEQTQIAYDALLNQGQCALFSRLVWNDIVDCLAIALEVGGIGWNDKYCSAEGCKINVQYGGLTATAFNSVRHNIDRFGIVHWTWATRETKEGYIGRAEVRGFETYGGLSDKVYGWYLIELTKRLNTLLDVLKDTADFSDLEHTSKIESALLADFGRAKSGLLLFDDMIAALVAADADRIVVKAVNALTYGQIRGIYEGKGIQTVAFTSVNKALIPYIAKAHGIRTALMNHHSGSPAKHEAEVSRIKTGILSYRNTIAANVNAVLRDIVFVGYLRYTGQAVSHSNAELEYYGSGMAEALAYARTKERINLSKAMSETVSSTMATWSANQSVLERTAPKEISATDYGLSVALGGLCYKTPKRIEAVERLASHEASHLEKRMPKAIKHQSLIRTYIKNEMERFQPVLIGRYIEAESTEKVILAGMIPITMDVAEQGRTNILANLRRAILSPQSTTEKVKGITDAQLAAGISKPVGTQEQAQSISHTEFGKLQAKYVKSTNTAEGCTDVELITGTPKPMASSQISESFKEAEFAKKEPKLLESQISAEIYELAMIAKCSGLTAEAASKIQAYVSVEMGVVSAKAIRAIAKAESVAVVELCKNTEDVWKEPIRSGNDLYIRSAHPQWQDGNTVHLDGGGKFYDAVQTGTNVYIRSVDSMKGVR